MAFNTVPHLNKKDTVERHVKYSKYNGMIPRLYVPEWKTDMKNRSLLLENADGGLNPHHEHDEPLFKDKREQLSYNVEDRSTVDRRYALPNRARLLAPNRIHTDYRHISTCMYYRNGPDPRAPKSKRAYDMARVLEIDDKCRAMVEDQSEESGDEVVESVDENGRE